MNYCQHCGQQLPANTKFCPNCGQPVTNPTPQRSKRQQVSNHQSKSWWLIGGLLLVVGIGWWWMDQRQVAPQHPHSIAKSHTDSQASPAANQTQPAPKQDQSLWNQQKDDQLMSFINTWAPTMGQSYVKYDGVNPIDPFSHSYPSSGDHGGSYPDAFKNAYIASSDAEMAAVLKANPSGNVGSNTTMGWAPTGDGGYEYNVVAIYNYKPTGAGRITYAFAFHNGQPVALVNQTTNGGIDFWKPTANQDVANNFASIANGKGSQFHK